MLPSVTGARLFNKKRDHVMPRYVSAVVFVARQNASCANSRSNSPTGTKYMLAMLCSKPIATNAATGGTMAITLSVTDRADIDSHTARHTSALARMPETNAAGMARWVLVVAMSRARRPTEPSPASILRDSTTSIAVAHAPTMLPTYTTAQ